MSLYHIIYCSLALCPLVNMVLQSYIEAIGWSTMLLIIYDIYDIVWQLQQTDRLRETAENFQFDAILLCHHYDTIQSHYHHHHYFI